MNLQAGISGHGPRPAAHLGGRHSRRVDRLRFLLPAIALFLLGAVAAWPWLTGGYQGLIVPVLTLARDQENNLMRMANPRYVGHTKASEPFEVTAASAFLDPADTDRIRLERLRAHLERPGTAEIRLHADEGTYMREANALDLHGNLQLTFSEGYRFVTSGAHVDLARGDVRGGAPIQGRGPLGTLAADAFDVKDGGRLLRFQGRVQVVVRPGEPAT